MAIDIYAVIGMAVSTIIGMAIGFIIMRIVWKIKVRNIKKHIPEKLKLEVQDGKEEEVESSRDRRRRRSDRYPRDAEGDKIIETREPEIERGLGTIRRTADLKERGSVPILHSELSEKHSTKSTSTSRTRKRKKRIAGF